MKKIHVDRAELSDIATVSSILQEAAAWLEESGVHLWKATDLDAETIQGEVAAGLYWLAHVDGEAAGCIRYQLEDILFWPDAPQGEAAYLHRLGVRRSHAGGVISAALLDWAKAYAREHGHDFLRLDCELSRPALHAIYESHGFVKVGEGEVGPYTVVLYEFDLSSPRDAV